MEVSNLILERIAKASEKLVEAVQENNEKLESISLALNDISNEDIEAIPLALNKINENLVDIDSNLGALVEK